jgi:phospholipase C
MFLEKRFGVKEPQISNYRRAICGDLTSAFNFDNPNDEPLPTLNGSSTKEQVDALTAAQQSAPKITPPTTPQMPVQATGIRPSRALPYELAVEIETDFRTGQVRLKFVNSGDAGAVFHVYDKLHLDRVPRRYAVEAHKSLQDKWAAGTDDAGKYDLWVLGPNGFHRHFAGDLGALDGRRAAAPEIEFEPDGKNGNARLTARNDGDHAVVFTVKSNRAYGTVKSRGDDFELNKHTGFWTATVRPNRQAEMTLVLRDTGSWYDLQVTVESDPTFVRRVAGRIETGRHSVSDPAMGASDWF